MWLSRQIRQDITYGEGVFLGVSHAPIAGPHAALPNFGVSFYLCIHPLTQNLQIWRGNTYGEELVFNGQARPTSRDGS